MLNQAFIAVDQPAKTTFRSRYAHTPFGSAPLPILSSQKVSANFVMRLEEGVSSVRHFNWSPHKKHHITLHAPVTS